jgi:hypothetical protein
MNGIQVVFDVSKLVNGATVLLFYVEETFIEQTLKTNILVPVSIWCILAWSY